MRILRLDELTERTGLSRTTLWRLERANEFPKRIQLSRNSVGWDESEISKWLSSRPRGLRTARPSSRSVARSRPLLEKVK